MIILVTNLTQRSKLRAKLNLIHDVLNNHSNASATLCSPPGGVTQGSFDNTKNGQGNEMHRLANGNNIK